MSTTEVVAAGLQFAEPAPVPNSLNILLYGPPGSGKSAALGTAPGPILCLNLEGGNALSYARKVAADHETDIHEVRVPHDARDISNYLRAVYRHVQSGADPVVRTVAVDTIGKVREYLAREFGADQPSKDSMQRWKRVADTMDGFVQGLRDLDVNVVLTAHEDISDDDGNGRIIRPKIGKHAEKVCAEADVVAYCGRAPDGTYTGVFAQVNERRAKDRSGGGLGMSRPLDIAEWRDAYRAALAPGAEQQVPVALPLAEPEPVAS